MFKKGKKGTVSIFPATISRKIETVPFLAEKVFCTQLKGKQRFLRLFGESTKPYGLASGLVSLKSQESVGRHNTKNKEEALIILQGQAQVSFGKRSRIKVKKNCFVYIPPQTDHDLKNIGQSILKYVYITAGI